MKKIITNIFCVFIILITLSMTVSAQNVNEAAVRAELDKRGIDAERFRQELLKKGVNPEAVDPSNPIEVDRATKAAQEVMAMLESEKNAPNPVTPSTSLQEAKKDEPQSKLNTVRSVDDPAIIASKQTQDIQKAVKEGATIEEAVSEKIQEKAKDALPDQVLTYGQHIFRDKSIQMFRSSDDAKPSKSYVLGVGDKVAVAIWGPTQENFALEIQKDGFVQPTNFPRIYLSGLTIAVAEELMYSRLRTKYFFAKENFALTVTTARTVNVNIVGEVYNNGTFNISAVNTAFNALVASGGPTDIGSVRKIQLLRSGQKPVNIDVYKYLQNPLISQDYFLQENDFINVPVAQKVINIQGAITRPFKYELLENENLKELIVYAGGLKANALKNNIQIKRIENDSIRIIDVNFFELEKSSRNFDLINGDEIVVSSINNIVKNEVVLAGAVEKPGVYALDKGESVYSLVAKGKLLPNAITSNSYLSRFNSDLKTKKYVYINLETILTNPSSTENLTLIPGDELFIGSKASFVDTFNISIEGAVRKPIELKLDVSQNIKVSDAIFFAEGLKDDALEDFAYIFRKSRENIKSQEYIKIDLKSILRNANDPANINLSPGDKLIVYSKLNYTDESLVTISGAVRKPGTFQYHKSLNLKDLFLLAGGVKFEASLDKVDIYRLVVDKDKSTAVLLNTLSIDEEYNVLNNNQNFILEPFDQIFVRNAPEFELQRTVNILGEVRYPGDYAIDKKNMGIADLIKSSGGLTAEAFVMGAQLKRKLKEQNGFIIIDLERALRNNKSSDNIPLQDGDEIFIPKISNIVTIKGATLAEETYPQEILAQGKIQVPYKGRMSAIDYINEFAGGTSKQAALNKITVKSASGKVSKTKNYLLFKKYPKVEPGSEIMVGYKEKESEKLPGEKEKEDIKWGEVISNTVSQAVAVLSLILLINNIN